MQILKKKFTNFVTSSNKKLVSLITLFTGCKSLFKKAIILDALTGPLYCIPLPKEGYAIITGHLQPTLQTK